MKHTFLRFLMSLLIPLALLSCNVAISPSINPNKANGGSDEINTFKVSGRYYEYKHPNKKEYGQGNYSTPPEMFYTTSGYYGASDAGYLEVSGRGIKKRGTINPQASDAYTSFEASSGISFKYTFKTHVDTSRCEVVTGEHQTDSRVVDGYELGGNIGSGALLVLKKPKGSNNFKMVADVTINNLSNGRQINYTPSGSEVIDGCYYRFVSAYLYREYAKSGSTGLLNTTDLFQYYSVLQRTTVYVAPGGTVVQFATSTTKVQEKKLKSYSFECEPRDTLDLSTANSVSALSLKNNAGENLTKFGTFKLGGNIIKGGETSTVLEKAVQSFVFNSDASRVEIAFSADKDISNMWEPQTLNLVNTIKTYHSGSKTTIVDHPISTASNDNFFVEKSVQNEDGKFSWHKIDDYSGLNSNRTISISVDDFSSYYLFRAVAIARYSMGDIDKIFAQVCYFQIVNNTDFYSNSYDFGDGQTTKLSANAASKMNGGSYATTLDDGSAVFSDLICNNPVSSYKVDVSYNDGKYERMAGSFHTFSDEGKYRFKVTNDFGEIDYTTIYVVDIGDDNGREAYFQDGQFISDKYRLYDPSSRIPSYAVGAEFKVLANKNRPGLYGKISYVQSDGRLEELQKFNDLKTELTGLFNKVGQYYIEIDTNNPAVAGDHLKFTISFNIKDPSSFTPYVNQELLSSGASSSTLMGKGYLVSYQSKGTGKYQFVFPFNESGYNLALDFADKLEVDTIKFPTEENNFYLYKDKEYTDKFELYQDLHTNAKKRIDVTYLNKVALGQDEITNYIISDYKTTPIDKDIYVVSDESIFKDFVSDQLYLNDFSFVQLRNYESSSVKLWTEDGKCIDAPYDVNMSDFLKESGVYRVEERNANGVSEYNAIFIKEGENTCVNKVSYLSNGKLIDATIDQKHSTAINATAIYFRHSEDRLDNSSLVVIYSKERGSKELCLASELSGKIMSVIGNYTLTFINRLGYSYSIDINLSGNEDSHLWTPHVDMSNPVVLETMK